MISRRRGLTLVEVVVSMVVMSIVVVGLASAMLLASHALPEKKSLPSLTVDSTDVADQIAEGLRSAIWITERSATAVTFTVPDRDGDLVPEKIRYAWAGTPGAPITRQYNNGTIANVVDEAQDFRLDFDLETVVETYPGTPVESAETELIGYESISSLSDAHIHDNNWWAEYFKPTLPVEALSWKVTRVQFMAKRETNDNYTTTIQLRLPDVSYMPSNTIIDSTTMAQLSLTDSYQWIEKSFSNATDLDPNTGLYLAFITYDSRSARLKYQSKDVVLPNTSFIEGNPAWIASYPDRALLFHIFGTYMMPGPPQTASRYYVTGVRITVQAEDDTNTRVVTSTQTLNVPELLSGMWETDFNNDPTIDHNGDGSPDWVTSGGWAFNLGSLNGGVWTADTTLNTNPLNDFTELTTVNVRFRDTAFGASAAIFQINADWSGSTYTSLLAYVSRGMGSTQTVTVYHTQDNSTQEVLVTVPGLPIDFVNLRLLIDPDLDTVNVQVDGDDYGTYTYNTLTQTSNDRFATITSAGGGAEFDYVSMRVGEGP